MKNLEAYYKFEDTLSWVNKKAVFCFTQHAVLFDASYYEYNNCKNNDCWEKYEVDLHQKQIFLLLMLDAINQLGGFSLAPNDAEIVHYRDLEGKYSNKHFLLYEGKIYDVSITESDCEIRGLKIIN